uniref:uncharacterized protein LOC120334890 n=1 Tax=Styela clava TaxID=7725 RepID=UPI00193A03F2|nr:uncharacterized protein LOC120334890 [Styela clava]
MSGRSRKRNSRRSSILKKSPSRQALDDLDTNVDVTEYTRFDNVTNTQTKYSKRVSFADTNQIKEIFRVADIAKDWHDSSASDNSLSKLHDPSNLTTPLIKKSRDLPTSADGGSKDIENLMKGPIVGQEKGSNKLNETSESCVMDMTNISDVGIRIIETGNEAKPDVPQKLPFNPGFSFFDNSKLDFGQTSSKSLEDKENIRVEISTESEGYYTKDFLKSLQLIETKPDEKTKPNAEENVTRPHINPPSYAMCLAGVAGRRSILATPLETSKNENDASMPEQVTSDSKIVKSNPNVPMDFMSADEDLSFTCVDPKKTEFGRNDLMNNMPAHDTTSGEDLSFTCVYPGRVASSQDKLTENMTILDPSSGDDLSFTCVNPGNLQSTKIEQEKDSSILEPPSGNDLSFTCMDPVKAQDKTRNDAYPLDSSSGEDLSFTCVNPTVATAMSNAKVSNTDAMDFTCTTPGIFNAETDSSENDDIFVPDNQPSCSNPDEKTRCFVFGSDEMDITRTADKTIDCGKEDILVPDTQPMSGLDNDPTNEEILVPESQPMSGPENDLSNEEILIPDTQPMSGLDNDPINIVGSGDIVNETVMEIGAEDLSPEPIVEGGIGSNGGPNDLNNKDIPDTQIETIQNGFKADSASETLPQIRIGSDTPPSDETEDIDVWETSAFKRKMARARNSIGLYKARQERENLLKESLSEMKSPPEAMEVLQEKIISHPTLIVEDTDLGVNSNPVFNGPTIPVIIVPETPSFSENETNQELPVVNSSNLGTQKTAIKRRQNTSIFSSANTEKSSPNLEATRPHTGSVINPVVPSKVPRICTEEIGSDSNIKGIEKSKAGNSGKEISKENWLGVGNIQTGMNSSTLSQDSVQLRIATALDKSIMEEINRNQMQKKDQNITVDEFLQDYANINIKNLRRARQSIVVPSSATEQPKGLKEMFKAVNWTGKEVAINECFVNELKKKIEWLEGDIAKIEEEMNKNNPEIFNKVRIGGDESEELCEKLQKMFSCCKMLGKAYWKRDACKLYKGLHQASKQYLEEDLTPVTSKLGLPQDLIDAALKEIEEANKNLDEMIENYESREKPPAEEQANLYEENQTKLDELEKEHEELQNWKLTSTKEKSERQERRQKLINRILKGNNEENERRKKHKEVTEALKSWRRYCQWRIKIHSERKLEFSFLYRSLSLTVEFENEVGKFEAGNKVVSYLLKTNTLPGNVIRSEVENFKMYHKFFKNCIDFSQLKEKYPDFAALKMLLRQMSILSSAIDELIEDVDWISCQFGYCSCHVTSEDCSITVWIRPTMTGVDGFNIKLFFTNHDSALGDDLVLSVLKNGCQISSHEFIPGRRQLKHVGKAEVASMLSSVAPGRHHLKRSVQTVLKGANNSE